MTVDAAPPLIRPLDLAPPWQMGMSRPFERMRPPLDILRITRDAGLIIALLLINKGGNAGAAVFFTILVAMVLKSPQAAFKALAICWLGLMINTAFVPKSLLWTPARLALPLIAFVRFSIDMSRMNATLFTNPTYLAFLAYVLMMAVCSIVSGWYMEIALIKLANYWAVVSAVLSGVTVLRRSRVDVTEWLVSLMVATTFVGIAAIALGLDNNFRAIAAGSNENIFVGAFLHPNCHSVYGALFVTFLATVLLTGDYPRRNVTIPLIGIWSVFMIWSKARASVLATLIGVAVLLVLAQPFRNRFGWRLRVNVRRSTLLIGLVVTGVAMLFADAATSGSISQAVLSFVAKRGDIESTGLDTEKVLASRQGLIDRALLNFREHPFFGIGFQVSTDDAFIQNATLFTAPVEKGVIFAALLEEGGIFGTTAFVVFVLVMVGELLRNRNVPGLAMLAAYLGSNLGEVTFFSPGGSGAFGWIMMSAAMLLGDHCWRRGPSVSLASWPPSLHDGQRYS
jgi:hypothetical protein